MLALLRIGGQAMLALLRIGGQATLAYYETTRLRFDAFFDRDVI